MSDVAKKLMAGVESAKAATEALNRTVQPTCPPDGHVWADEFTDGDTCHCGEWYLTQDANGSFRISR